MHKFETITTRKMYGLASNSVIPPLNEERAIASGAQMLSETIIFSMAGGILMFEYARSSEKDALKAAQLRGELDRLQLQIDQLQAENDRLMKKVFPENQFQRETIPSQIAGAKGFISWLMNSNSEKTDEDDVAEDGSDRPSIDERNSSSLMGMDFFSHLKKSNETPTSNNSPTTNIVSDGGKKDLMDGKVGVGWHSEQNKLHLVIYPSEKYLKMSSEKGNGSMPSKVQPLNNETSIIV